MRISVVIPSYNRADYLPQTLASVQRQTRPPDEIIVVNDGSTDNTLQVVAHSAPEARVLTKRSGSAGGSRAWGTRHTTGEALLFLDSDDLILPDALKQLEQALLSRPQAVLAYSTSQTVNADGKVIEALWSVGNETEQEFLWEALARQNFVRSPGCVLVRREPLLLAGGWQPRWGVEDWDLWLRLAEEPGAVFARVKEPLFQYRSHEAGLSTNSNRMYDAMRRMYEDHQERWPRESAQWELLAHLLMKFPPRVEEAPPVVEVPITVRHTFLRRTLEGTGVAPLYRRLPYGTRVRMRRLFGLDVNA